MADLVSVGRLIVGHGDNRRVIAAGDRFDTRTLGIDDNEAEQMERRGILRRPRDDVRRQAAVAGPAAEGDEEVVEGRSGPATNARSPGAQAAQAEDSGTGDTSGASSGDGGTGETAPRTGARRSKTSDLDL